MSEQIGVTQSGHARSRREAIKVALKVGAYTAPVLLTATSLPTGVSAATPPPTAAITITPDVFPHTAPPQTPFTITGTGFPPNAALAVRFTRPEGGFIAFPNVGASRADGTLTLNLSVGSISTDFPKLPGVYTAGIQAGPYDQNNPVLATAPITLT